MTALDKLKSQYLTEAEVAKFLKITVKTLRNRVSARKDHPPKIDGTDLYPAAEFEKWLKARTVHQFNKAS